MRLSVHNSLPLTKCRVLKVLQLSSSHAQRARVVAIQSGRMRYRLERLGVKKRGREEGGNMDVSVEVEVVCMDAQIKCFVCGEWANGRMDDKKMEIRRDGDWDWEAGSWNT